MAQKRKRSKKPSAASSTAVKRLEETVFYLDESIYSRVLANAMREAGANVRTPVDACGFGATDDDWLRVIGERGWIALMRDQKVRYRTLERTALTQAGVGAFVFTGGQATAADTATIICSLLKKFIAVSTSEPKPFMYCFGLGGTLSRVQLRK